MGGGVIVIRPVDGVVVEPVVWIVISEVGTVMLVTVVNVDGAVVADELVDELVAELEVDDDGGVEELVDVDPAADRVAPDAVTRLERSAAVTSGRSTALVPGMVLDSSGVVDEGKISVRVSPPGPKTWRTATSANTANSTSGTTLLSTGSIPIAP